MSGSRCRTGGCAVECVPCLLGGRVRESEVSHRVLSRRPARVPIRAQYTSVPRSAANPAAPFRVAIISAGPTDKIRTGQAHICPTIFLPCRARSKTSTAPDKLHCARDPERGVVYRRQAARGIFSDHRTAGVPKPPDDVLKRLVAEHAIGRRRARSHPIIRASICRRSGRRFPVAYVAIAARRPRGTIGPPFQFPVPQMCLGESACRCP